MTPSYPGPAAWPHRLERGVAELERLGYRARLMPHALDPGGAAADWVAATPAGRAGDLNAAFADPEVRAVVAAIGGDHSAQMLPHLDWDAISANPTILVGYSDVTVLSVAIWVRTGMITFSGPCLLTEFAEYPHMPTYTRDSFLRAVTSTEPLGELVPSDSWTDEFLDWDERADLVRARHQRPNEGWRWLGHHESGGRAPEVEGALIGGCLESLQHLRGTLYWPSPEQWEGAVLFIETSEECPTPDDVDAILTDYENMGVLDRVGALAATGCRWSPAWISVTLAPC